jgi:DNA-binding transcriptional ArsR family regulator
MMDSTLNIQWDIGTAYDMFVSLRILHIPESFGLRPKWASGMRARLSNQSRDTLEQAETLLFAKRPTHWVHSLPPPRNGATVLAEMARIPPPDRLAALVFTAEIAPGVTAILSQVAEQGEWDNHALGVIEQEFVWWTGTRPSTQEATQMLDLWARADEFGNQYLAMLQEYYDVFFAEEERRLQPALEIALEKAQSAYQELAWEQFLAEVVGGVSPDEFPAGVTDLTLVPSYWVTPYAFRLHASPTHFIIAFSGRPPGASLVPGEEVSDMLISALKAIADPTRLRILQYLAESPATPTQLARRLRLRTSTIGHHLKQLQLVGLVRVNQRQGKEIHYVARIEDVDALQTTVRQFVNKDDDR